MHISNICAVSTGCKLYNNLIDEINIRISTPRVIFFNITSSRVKNLCVEAKQQLESSANNA